MVAFLIRVASRSNRAWIPCLASGVEGCAWDGEDLLLVSEDRSLYRTSLSH
ncbi:MAG: hypothetical protein MUF25_26540 [Pirellulaceae bacterium]|nr:hypothetical protein [Pirellulaceae bacterium]